MLSFGKILLIVVVAVGALLAYRIIGVVKNVSAERGQPPAPPKAGQSAKASELTSCPVCSTYTDAACDRTDCPLRR